MEESTNPSRKHKQLPSITTSPVQSPLPQPTVNSSSPRIGNSVQPNLNLPCMRISSGCRQPPPRRCCRCKKRGHLAQDCKQKKQQECSLCGDRTHTKKGCYFRNRPKVQVFMEQTTTLEELGTMTLEDRVALLDRPEPSPKICCKCGKWYPGHTELACPQYEYCGRCRHSGAYGFRARHRCQPEDEDQEMSDAWNDCDADLWHNDDV